jgi:hypothetical protein
MSLATAALLVAIGATLYFVLRLPLKKTVTSHNRLYELLRILLYRGVDGARLELFTTDGNRIGIVRKSIAAVDEVYLMWTMSIDEAERSFKDAYEAARAVADDLSNFHGIKANGDCYGYLHSIHPSEVRIGFSSSE